MAAVSSCSRASSGSEAWGRSSGSGSERPVVIGAAASASTLPLPGAHARSNHALTLPGYINPACDRGPAASTRDLTLHCSVTTHLNAAAGDPDPPLSDD